MKVLCNHCGTVIELPVGAGHAIVRCPGCGNEVSTEDTLDVVTEWGRPDEQPAKIDRFEIIETLGTGATASVVKARDTALGRVVTLKLQATLDLSGQRLLQEAHIISRLDHPNIVRVLEMGRDDGRHFIVCQYVEGETLKDWRIKVEPSASEIVELCVKLSTALEHVHSRNVIHRDLKPPNIVVDSLGEPHIIDFGLATDSAEVLENRPGHLVGTPTYMSPEQARGDARQDARSDIYTLGVILYELLSGRVPHQGNLPTLLVRIANEMPPPLAGDQNGIPQELDAICMKCLEKDPAERFQSARELADALSRFESSPENRTLLMAQLKALRARNLAVQEEANERQRRFVAAQSAYRLLAEDLPLCVVRKNIEGRFLFANDAFCKTFNRSIDDLKDTSSSDVLPPDVAAMHTRREAEVISTGRTIDSVEAYGTGEETKTFEVQRTPIRDPTGEIIGVQTIMWDVSAHAKAEQALRDAKEAAEAASQAKSSFLANVSHEFRTPMHAIIGLTGVLLRRSPSSESGELLRLIAQSAESLLTIINDILDFSRLEARRLELENVEFDVWECVRGVAKLFEHEAVRKQIEWNCVIAEQVPRRCVGDVVRIRQVLLNLVSNAIKFTSQGQVDLAVSREDPAGDDRDGGEANVGSVGAPIRLHFVVTDTGVGIPVEKRERIFEPFERGDASITRKHGGTGLGLAICAELTKLMHGRLWVESRPEEGSEFHLLLDLEVGSPGDGESAEADVDRDCETQPLRVLVVEDQPINQVFAGLVLEELGHAVTVAGNGAEAIGLYRSQDFDIVLMDLQMPEVDGLTAAKEIRRIEKSGETRIPIVAMTAHASREDRDRCLAAGMDGFLTKPIRHVELLDALKSFADFRPDLAGGAAESERPSPHTTFDSKKLMERVQGDPTVFRRVLEMFDEDVGLLRSEVADAMARADRSNLARVVHKLNGVVRNLDAHNAAGLLTDLEEASRHQDFAAIESLWRASAEELERLQSDIMTLLGGTDG